MSAVTGTFLGESRSTRAIGVTATERGSVVTAGRTAARVSIAPNNDEPLADSSNQASILSCSCSRWWQRSELLI